MAHCICAACLASSSGRLPCRSVEPPLTPNPLACGSLDVLHPNAAGADIGSDFHVVAVAPPGTDCVEVRLLRRLHRRLARPGRRAEAAPRRYRRHGGHRRVLDCVVRPARSQGVPGSPGGPPPDPTGPGPPQERHPGRPVDSPPAQPGSAQRRLPTRRGHPRVAQLPAPNAPGWSPSVAGPSSTCRRPWSRSTSN